MRIRRFSVRKSPTFHTIKSRNGIALPLTLVVGFSVMMGLFSLLQYLPQMFTQLSRSEKLLAYNLMLSSSMDYFKYSIRNRWNWTEKGIKVGNPQTLADAAQAPYFLERLIWSSRFVEDPLTGVNVQLKRDPNDLSTYLGELSTFSLTIPFDDTGVLAPAHPLYQVAKALPPGVIQSITFSARRLHNARLPEDGRSVTLRLMVSIDLGAYGILGRGNQPFATEEVVFSPRTLDTFALYVAGAIRLDQFQNDPQPASSSPEVTDFRIPVFSKKEEMTTGSPGLVFLSPVFADRGVVLPQNGGLTKNYNGTTFSAPVTFGGGRIFEKNDKGNVVSWAPVSAGGFDDQMFASLKDRFGGFQNGVRLDGVSEQGLAVLFRRPDVTGKNPDTSLLNSCLENLQITNDLSKTAGTSLVIKTPGSGVQTKIQPSNGSSYNLPDEKFSYQLGFTGKNIFVPQDGLEPGNNLQCQEYDGSSRCGSKGNYVDEFKVRTDKNFAESSSLNVSVNFYAPPGDGESKLLAQVNADLSSLSVLDVKLKDVFLNQAKSDYDSAKDAEEEAKEALENSNKIGQGVSKEDPELKEPTPETLANYNAAKAALDAAKVAYDNAKATTPGAPRIAVSTSPVKDSNGNELSNEIRLRVSIENEGGFRYLVPRIRIAGYDVGFDGGVDKRTTSTALNSNLVEIAYTFPSSANALVPPANITGNYSSANPSKDPQVVADGPTGNALNTAVNCSSRPNDISAGAAAFPAAEWDYPFWQQSEFSMNFKPAASYTWNSSNASLNPPTDPNWNWPVQSIVDNCYIEPSARLVVGYFTCRNLHIRPRTQPLEIYGTFLVGKAFIDSSAINSGITWGAIFHPQVAKRLLATGRLGRNLSQLALPYHCNDISGAFPIWHPRLPLKMVSALFSCSVNSLRVAEPFTWTHLSDCGIKDGDSGTSCSHHDLRHNPSTISYVTNVIN